MHNLRLLDAAIKEESLDWKESAIQRLASHCNDKKKAAKTVSEASDEMFLASFIKECGPCVVEGMVIKVCRHCPIDKSNGTPIAIYLGLIEWESLFCNFIFSGF